MKNLLVLTALFLTINLAGCYTVIWSPGEEFPSEKNSEKYQTTTGGDEGYYYDDRTGERYYIQDSYYSPNYYGPYSGYYERPWWHSVNPDNVYNETKKENRSSDGSALRNNEGSGRNRDDRRGDIIKTAPPTTSGGSGSGSTTSSSGSGSSGSSSGSSTKTSSDEKKSDTNTIRNNDGGRNTDRGKR